MAETWSDWAEYDQSVSVWEPAVYEFRLCCGSAVPIPRLLGTDKEGLLSIGETNNMEGRRKAFYSSTFPDGYGHPAGKMLGLIAELTILRKKFPKCTFQYRFIKMTKAKAKEKQDELLVRYILEFGEPPPLNGVIPDRWNSGGLWHKVAAARKKKK